MMAFGYPQPERFEHSNKVWLVALTQLLFYGVKLVTKLRDESLNTDETDTESDDDTDETESDGDEVPSAKRPRLS